MIGVTEYEYSRLKALKPFISYTLEEKEFMLGIVRQHIDQDQRVCVGCGNSVHEMKQKLYTWFNEFEPTIINELAASKEVADYTNDNE